MGMMFDPERRLHAVIAREVDLAASDSDATVRRRRLGDIRRLSTRLPQSDAERLLLIGFT